MLGMGEPPTFLMSYSRCNESGRKLGHLVCLPTVAQ